MEMKTVNNQIKSNKQSNTHDNDNDEHCNIIEKLTILSPLPSTLSSKNNNTEKQRLSSSTTWSSPLFPLLEKKLIMKKKMADNNSKTATSMRFVSNDNGCGILGNLSCIDNNNTNDNNHCDGDSASISSSSSNSNSCDNTIDDDDDESSNHSIESSRSGSSTESEIDVIFPDTKGMINGNDDDDYSYDDGDDEEESSDDDLDIDCADEDTDDTDDDSITIIDHDEEDQDFYGDDSDNIDLACEMSCNNPCKNPPSSSSSSSTNKLKKRRSIIASNMNNNNSHLDDNDDDDDIEVEILEITSDVENNLSLGVSVAEVISDNSYNRNSKKTRGEIKEMSLSSCAMQEYEYHQAHATPKKQGDAKDNNDIKTSPFYSPLKDIKKQQHQEQNTLEILQPQPPTMQSNNMKKIRQTLIKPGKWSLGSKIGSGSFGIVHMGMNDVSGQILAIKRIPYMPSKGSKHYKELKYEIDLMKTLKHPNIVQYLGSEISSKEFYIFQEWVPGGSLTSLLKKFGTFSIPVIRSYLYQIILGLDYLHDICNICHRDIKGGNILVDNTGVVKLADFGASKQILSCNNNHDHDDDDNDNEMMLSMSMKGTPYFMAPEVIEGKYGTKADVWSVGGVIIQMLTCQPPWKSLGFTNPMALFCHIKSSNQTPPLSSIDALNATKKCESLKRIINNCFERDITIRKSAKQLLKDSFFNESDDDDDDDDNNNNNNEEKIISPLTKQKQRKKKMSSINKKNNDNVVIKKHWPEWAKKSYKNKQQSNAIQDAMNELSICDDDYDDKENSFNKNPVRRI